MKKVSILIFAFVLSAFISEAVIANLVRYPAYGVEYKVAYRKGGATWTNVRKPHSKLFNVEGKNLIKVNNFGFPGNDIEQIESPIVILGSSYVEAFQYKPDEIASSLFAEKLRKTGTVEPVLNLGCSGHDPYDSWFRLQYFENKYSFVPKDIILVINSDNESWFARHTQPFDFSLPASFGNKHTGKFMNIVVEARNRSSIIEVFAKTVLKSDDIDLPAPQDDVEIEAIDDSGDYILSKEMEDCLKTFAEKYDGFMVVSIVGDFEFNQALSEFCQIEGIEHKINSLGNPRYMIDGAGHLNQEGNIALSEALFEIYQENQKR